MMTHVTLIFPQVEDQAVGCIESVEPTKLDCDW